MINSGDVTCLFVQEAVKYSYSWREWTKYPAITALIYWIMQLFSKLQHYLMNKYWVYISNQELNILYYLLNNYNWY